MALKTILFLLSASEKSFSVKAPNATSAASGEISMEPKTERSASTFEGSLYALAIIFPRQYGH